MKKLLLIALLGAISGSAWGAAGTDGTLTVGAGATFDVINRTASPIKASVAYWPEKEGYAIHSEGPVIVKAQARERFKEPSRVISISISAAQ